MINLNGFCASLSELLVAGLFLTATLDAAAPQAPSGLPASNSRTAGYLKASNPGEDDQLAAGGALKGVALGISRDGNTLAVGASLEDSAATGANGNQRDESARDSGAVYVFARNGNRWAQQAYVKASNTQISDHFGMTVALSGDGNTLAVAATLEDSAATGVNGNQSDNSAEDSGAVYIFTRRGGAWSQQAYVKASNTGEGDQFGYALALSHDGNTLAAGAMDEDSISAGINGNQADNSANGAGAVYVFTRSGNNWSQQAYVKPAIAQGGDLFGFCLGLSSDGNTLAVCAFDEDGASPGVNGDPTSNAVNGSGAAYVFTRSGSTWTQQAYIKASNPTPQAAFGTALALSGDGNTLAVCAIDEDGLEPGVNATQWQGDRPAASRTRDPDHSAGAVYVFARSGGGVWSQQAYVKSSNIQRDDYFGLRLALNQDGSVLAAGAPLQAGAGTGVNPRRDDFSAPESGAVYVFRRSGAAWSQQAYVKAPNAESYDQFGSALAVSGDGDTLAVGAMGEDGSSAGFGGNQADNSTRDSGAVYIY